MKRVFLSFCLLIALAVFPAFQYVGGAFTPGTPSLWAAQNTVSGTPIFISAACSATALSSSNTICPSGPSCPTSCGTFSHNHLYIVGITNTSTSTSSSLSSATGDSGAFTLAYCAGCANTFTSCYSVDVATGNNSDCGYLYYTGSTITLTSSLIVTRSALAGAWRWWYVDVTRNTGTPTYDVANSRDQSTSTYNPSGVTLVGYTGSNDVVVQSISAGNAAYSCGGSNPGTPFSWIGSYTESALGSAGVAILPGTGSVGTPPTWCTSYSKSALSAIAFY